MSDTKTATLTHTRTHTHNIKKKKQVWNINGLATHKQENENRNCQHKICIMNEMMYKNMISLILQTV